MNRHSFSSWALPCVLAAALGLACSEKGADAPGPAGGVGGSDGVAGAGGAGGSDVADASDSARGADAKDDVADDGGGGGGPSDVSLDGAGGGGARDGSTVDTGGIADGVGISDGGDARARDPFAPQPDTSEGLTNVSADLDAVLERGTLKNACAAWQADPQNRRLKLLCGKSMFFYEGFGTAGIPKPFVTWLISSFPNEVGPGLEKLGMVTDPSSIGRAHV